MDGKNFLAKVREVLLADTTLITLFSGTPEVVKSEFSPKGNTYPQICIFIEEKESEQVFPVTHGELYVTVWSDKESGADSIIENIKKAILRALNRKSNVLTEIDHHENEGLRVVQCLKTSVESGFDDNCKKYFRAISFKVIISEDEDFSETTGDNEWV